jgi:tetratricopeptide (TPR) repeat protein
MFRQIGQLLVQGFQQLQTFVSKENSALPVAPGEPLPSLTDAEHERLFIQLLEEVKQGWQQADITQFFMALEPRSHHSQWLTWLQSFGDRLLASGATHLELAVRMVKFGEVSSGELGNIAQNIGFQLLERARLKEEAGLPNNEVETPQIEPELPNNDQLAEIWFQQGYQQAIAGDFPGAIASWSKTIEIQPNYYQAWYNLGLAYDNLGDGEAAIKNYDRALEINPNLDDVWHNRGNVLDDLGRSEEAIASYNRALEINPNLAQTCYNQGVVLSNLERYEEAIQSYGRALEINPNLYEAWYNQAVALETLGREEEAIASFNKAKELQATRSQPLA